MITCTCSNTTPGKDLLLGNDSSHIRGGKYALAVPNIFGAMRSAGSSHAAEARDANQKGESISYIVQSKSIGLYFGVVVQHEK